jgi:hypothetical protein
LDIQRKVLRELKERGFINLAIPLKYKNPPIGGFLLKTI